MAAWCSCLFQVGLELLFDFLSCPFSFLSTPCHPGWFTLPLLSSAQTCFHLFSQMTRGRPSLISPAVYTCYWTYHQNVRAFHCTALPGGPGTLPSGDGCTIHLWAAAQCNTVDIRGLSQVDLKNGLELMVLANKWHSLISGEICLSGQLVGGHHTRSELPGCSGRTRKWKRGRAGRERDEKLAVPTEVSFPSLPMLDVKDEFEVWTLVGAELF